MEKKTLKELVVAALLILPLAASAKPHDRDKKHFAAWSQSHSSSPALPLLCKDLQHRCDVLDSKLKVAIRIHSKTQTRMEADTKNFDEQIQQCQGAKGNKKMLKKADLLLLKKDRLLQKYGSILKRRQNGVEELKKQLDEAKAALLVCLAQGSSSSSASSLPCVHKGQCYSDASSEHSEQSSSLSSSWSSSSSCPAISSSHSSSPTKTCPAGAKDCPFNSSSSMSSEGSSSSSSSKGGTWEAAFEAWQDRVLGRS